MGCLKNLVITAVGDVGPGKGNEQLRRWVEANSGRWQPRVTKDITHVICSKDAWKRNSEAVQQAKKLGVFIVSYDWLEDSLQKKRKLAENKYTWEVLRKQRRTQKELKRLAPKSDALKFRKGCDLAKEDLGSGTSAPRKSGFFASSLEDMRKRREAREAAKATTTTLSEDKSRNSGKDTSVTSSRPTAPTTPKSTKSSSPLPSSPMSKLEASSSPSEANGTISRTSSPTPTSAPSVFPPCLKYTPSIASPSSKASATPAPCVVKEPAVTKLTDLYHVYCDGTGFEYNILMVRQNPYLNNFAKYTLRLYESHTKPHVYATAVRYTPPVGNMSGGGLPIANTGLKDVDFSAILWSSKKSEKAKKAATTASGSIDTSPSSPPTTAMTEAARLAALIAPPTPSPTAPYNKIVTPPNSPFDAALLTFRHIFRDLTLITWEERLQTISTPLSSPFSLQRLRAQAFRIEPFIWRPPPMGMPLGLMPKGLENVDSRVLDTTYTRNRWGLPALDEPLGDQGAVASALVREAEEANRKAKEEEQRAKKNAEMSKAAAPKAKKPNYRQPLFNGVSGRPDKDEYGRYFQRASPASIPLGSPSPAPRATGGDASSTSVLNAHRGGTGIGIANLNGNGKRDGRAVFTQFPRPKRNDWRQSSFFGEQ